MGKFIYEEYINSAFDATVYRIDIYHDKEKGLSEQDVMSIESTLKRYRSKHPYCSYLLVESTRGNVGYRRKAKSKKPGRPKVMPIGKKVPRHAHVYIAGDKDNSAWTYGTKVTNAINKRLNKAGLEGKRTRLQSIGKTERAINSINYAFRQADYVRTGGDFDFYKFRDCQKLSG